MGKLQTQILNEEEVLVEKWPLGIVYYDFQEKEFSEEEQLAILAAIKDIEDNSCVRFLQRTPETDTYVLFRNIGPL
jgi:hypothetical protein